MTVVGAAGSGKTRIAIEVATRFTARFVDGIYFVDLTAADAAPGVVPAFVEGIGRATPPGRSGRDHLLMFLADCDALVVVDNCEHVLEPAAEFIDELLGRAPGVHVLATSRALTELAGETIYPLGPLDATTPEAAASRLFVERALATNARLVVDDGTRSMIAEIVARLDGMPLAIELAAARTRTLSLAQIVEHLEDRFRLLVGSHRADQRQRSLEAAISWSYELLDPEDQRLFCALSVCAGPFALTTVARLVDEDEIVASYLLDRLVSRSLVSVVETGGDMHAYQLLESLRAFGRNRLDAAGDLDDAQVALERALLPAESEQQDPSAFINGHVVWNERTSIEGRTRRTSATNAIDAGRVEQGCLLLGTATGLSVAGSYPQMIELCQRLRAEQGDLTDGAELALASAELTLQLLTFRTGEAMVTIERELERLASGAMASRLFFDSWRLMSTMGFDPEGVVAESDEVLAALPEERATPGDHGTSMVAIASAIALLAMDRSVEAQERARAAVRLATPQTSTHHTALSTLLWIEYIEQLEHGAELEEARRLSSAIGLRSRVEIAATMASGEPLETRARRIVELARLEPLGRLLFEESLFVVPFAWLAMEEGDLDRASPLLDVFATPDPGTGAAGVRALERVHLSRTGEPLDGGVVMQRFVDPALHQRLLRLLPETLEAELEYWDARLAQSGAPQGRAVARADSVDVLGPLRARFDGQLVKVSAPQQRAILATLALRTGAAVDASTLIEAVWGVDAPETARRSLQAQISRLRSRLGPDRIHGDTTSGYSLTVADDAIDILRFREFRRRATESTPEDGAAMLEAALDEWRGSVGPDVADTSRVQAEITALHEQRTTTEDDLAAALVSLGRSAEAVEFLEGLAETAPLRERRWALLIDALVDSGRSAEALRTYHRARRILVEQHGIEPGEMLREAEARALAPS